MKFRNKRHKTEFEIKFAFNLLLLCVLVPWWLKFMNNSGYEHPRM